MPRGHAVYHFATKSDYQLVLADVSAQLRLKYVVYESRLQPDFRIYASPLDVPEFGVNKWPDYLGGVMFIVLPEDAPLHWEYWPNRQVPEKYGFFGQQGNDRSVMYQPSSYHKGEHGEGLLWGQFDTISKHPDSLTIFNAFKKSIRKRFERMGVCYVGPEATRMLDSGVRLTQDLRRPAEFDIGRV